MVLALVVGQFAWAVFGACTPMHRLLTGIAVFWIVQPAMYVFYMGGQYASLGMRVAAIGAMWALEPCKKTGFSHNEYSVSYHSVIDTVVGVFIMVGVEIVFAGDPPSKQLQKGLFKILPEFLETFKGYFEDTMSKEEVIAKVTSFEGRLGSLRDLATEAAKEPRWFREPFRAAFHIEIIRLLTKLNRLLHNLVHVLAASSNVSRCP